MNDKNIVNHNIISNLSDAQLDELLAYAPGFTEASLANIEAQALEKIKKRSSARKYILIAVAAILLLATSTVMLASATDLDFGPLLNSIFNNPTSANVMAVGVSTERDGIEITVIYAYADGNYVYIMLGIRDLQGSRLGENMVLTQDNVSTFISTPIIYDEAQGKATMGIKIRTDRPREVGQYLDFTIRSIITGHEQFFEILDFPLHEYAVEREMGRRSAHILDWFANVPEDPPEWLLGLGEMHIYMPGMEWGTISNIGLYNGLLHVQSRRSYTWGWHSNNGSLNVIDTDDNWFRPAFHFMHGWYTETIFDVSGVDNLTDLRLAARGVRSDEVITGRWAFSFPITSQAERRTMTIELPDSPYISHIEIDVSPMSTNIGYVAINDSAWGPPCPEIMWNVHEYVWSHGIPYITLRDGSTVELFRIHGASGPAGRVHHRYNNLYFDIEEIYSITVLGVERFWP